MKKISAAQANRQFSALLKEVASGATVLITSHGQPVAQMMAVSDVGPERARAKRLLLQTLESQRPTYQVKGKRDWTRDELYDRGDPKGSRKANK